MSAELPAIDHVKTAWGGAFRIGRDAMMTYKSGEGDNIIVNHTRVAKKSQGQGLGQALYHHMVGFARSRGLKVTPACSYVGEMFEKFPADADVLG